MNDCVGLVGNGHEYYSMDAEAGGDQKLVGEDGGKYGERAQKVLVKYIEEEYGKGEDAWDWVANLIMTRK